MKHFGPILDALLELNLQQQRIHNARKMDMSHLDWLLEHGTVTISPGRQTGKTSAIQHRASSKDIVVVMKRDNAIEFNAHKSFNPTVVTEAELLNGSMIWRGRSFDRVWIDNAQFMSGELFLNVFENAAASSVKQIIMLG